MAPLVGLGSIKFVPSLLYALPALNARMGSAIEVKGELGLRRVVSGTATSMSLSNLTIEDTSGWGQESLQGDNFVRDAIRKEAVIK